MKRITELWNNRKEIAEGVYNYFFGSKEIKKLSKERLAICRTNKCGYYDPKGESINAFIPGKESCGVCGCLSKTMTSCKDCKCSLITLNKQPLW